MGVIEMASDNEQKIIGVSKNLLIAGLVVMGIIILMLALVILFLARDPSSPSISSSNIGRKTSPSTYTPKLKTDQQRACETATRWGKSDVMNNMFAREELKLERTLPEKREELRSILQNPEQYKKDKLLSSFEPLVMGEMHENVNSRMWKAEKNTLLDPKVPTKSLIYLRTKGKVIVVTLHITFFYKDGSKEVKKFALPVVKQNDNWYIAYPY